MIEFDGQETSEIIVPHKRKKNIPIVIWDNCGGPFKHCDCDKFLERKESGFKIISFADIGNPLPLVKKIKVFCYQNAQTLWTLFPKI